MRAIRARTGAGAALLAGFLGAAAIPAERLFAQDVVIDIVEQIAVTETPMVVPPAVIEVAEAIAVADVPGLEPQPVALLVNTTDDLDDGACDATHCSLREAINASNTTSSRDLIAFAIPGDGPHTIWPASALPAIEDPVFIDGYTQPGASPNTLGPEQGSNAVLMVELDGTAAEDARWGLRLWSDDSTVRGLVVNGWDEGIQVAFGDRNRVQGSFIGTDVTGTRARPNGNGVRISAGAEETVIGTDGDGVADMAERNLISGNDRGGVHISQGSLTHVTDRNVVAGNLIGTDVTGTEALPNQRGVSLISQTNDNRIGTDRDGVADEEERNVISGNVLEGVSIQERPPPVARPHRTVVTGNHIGTDPTGTRSLGNGGAAVRILRSPDNVVEGNLLTENAGGGVEIVGTEATGNRILGNTIARNGAHGVRIVDGTGNTILHNVIFENDGLGIDLGGDGVTPNDEGDADEGANGLQNFPVLTNAEGAGGRLRSAVTITGVLHSAPGRAFAVQLFAGETCEPSLHGEGAVVLGQASVTTDDTGTGSFSETFFRSVSFTSFLTATATDEDTGDTSEFSRCRSAAFAVVDAGDQEIVDAPLSDGGTLITAASTGGLAAAELVACGLTALAMTAGDEIELRCGSAGVIVLEGPVEIRLDDNTDALVPTGGVVTVEETEEGELQLVNESPEGSDPVLLSVDGTVVGEVGGGTTLDLGTIHVEKAELEVDRRGRVGGKVELEGTFVAGTAGGGFDVLAEDVLITLGPFVQTIPAGAFEADGRRGGFKYESDDDAGGVDEMRIAADGSFKIEAAELDLAGLDLSAPVPFALRIGDDMASLALPFGADGELLAGLLAAGALPLDVPLRLTPDSLTVSPGGSAVFTVRLGGSGFFAGRTVSLACEGLPAGASCAFDPPTVTPTETGGVSTLRVTTTARGVRAGGPVAGRGALPAMPAVRPGALLAALIMTALLLGLPLARVLAIPRRRAVLLPLTLLAAAAILASACGDSPTDPSGTGLTPDGTHRFTVVASAGSETHAVEARVTVTPAFQDDTR